MYTIVSEVESAAFYDGHYLAFGFAAGSCRHTFCGQMPDCQAMKGDKCRFSLKSRPSMEAVGIDVYKMVALAGWDIYPIGSGAKAQDVPKRDARRDCYRSMSDNALLIFLRYPEAGKVKRRLSEEVGSQRAAEVYEKLIRRTLGVACDFKRKAPGTRVVLFYTPHDAVDKLKERFGAPGNCVPRRENTSASEWRMRFGPHLKGAPINLFS